MPTPKAIADKTLTTLLGASVAINGFFAQRAFAMLDSLDKRTSTVEVASAVNLKVDEYQDQRLTKNNDRLLTLESWYAKVKAKKEHL
jgi:hypothetical protein